MGVRGGSGSPRTPWIMPSSPPGPCSALNTTSGRGSRSASRAGRSRRTSIATAFVARLGQRPNAGLAGCQADLPLGPTSRPSARRRACAQPSRRTPAGSPIRRISQRRSTPECARTRRRTSSPSASRSAAVALPRLIKKLQCCSDTWASPIARPRQPGAAIDLPGAGAGRVGEGLNRRSGCGSAGFDPREAPISAIRAAIASGSPGPAAQRRAGHDPALRPRRNGGSSAPSRRGPAGGRAPSAVGTRSAWTRTSLSSVP